MSDTAQQQLIAALHDARRFPHPARRVRVIETHISWVLLAGRHAYKIKKALNLGFLDFSTLNLRRHFCEEELRLNRRLAPQLYQAVLPLGGTPDEPVFGQEPAFEYAVVMRRFPPEALFDRLLQRERITPAHIDGLARLMARFHASLPAGLPPEDYGSAAAITAAAEQNFVQLRGLPGVEAGLLDEVQQATRRALHDNRALFEARRLHGCVRECHGDLHLGNIALIRGEPLPFDGIEFSPALRWLDVLDEIAFTVMDLMYHGADGLAWRLLNAYLEQNGDYAGLPLLPGYLAYRATVRAKVAALRAAQPGMGARARQDLQDAARRHLQLAVKVLTPRRAALLITHGLPGSGKTTFSQAVLERLPAIRLRSDVERKRLHGLRPEQDSQGRIYGAEATARTYAHLLHLARTLLQAGFNVIVDAAFLRQAERAEFAALAEELHLPFVIASLPQDRALLSQRIAQRQQAGRDASEAGLAVLQQLSAVQQPLSAAERAHVLEVGAAGADDAALWPALQARLWE